VYKILLVEDEEPIRRMLKTVLEMDDFSVETAGSAGEGIQILRTGSFDAVVTDLRMESAGAGYDVVRAAKALSPNPLAVILTAFPVPPSDWRSAGADALITKGGGPLELPKRLSAMLHKRASYDATHPKYRQVSHRRT
jgi:DNA-binding response OmpR family regulator